uniref:Nacre protein n=1 Tax=Pinctada fucata TaxID=50426 RepID=L8B2P8_PINFU|nr:nacre protein [Pinctada fucata]
MVSHAHIVSWLLVLVIMQLEAWPCNDKSTPYNDDGNGDMVFLDRHKLRCFSKGLVRFQLDLKISQIKYEYFCCKLPKKTTKFSFKTGFTDDGDGHVAFLDRQKVDCGMRGVITGFNLQRNEQGNRVRYNVICRKFVTYLKCYIDATTWQIEENGQVHVLAKHNVKCSSGYSISSFLLQRNAWHQLRYEYRCCKP